MGLIDDILKVVTGNDNRRIGLSPDAPTVSDVTGAAANFGAEYSGIPAVERIATGQASWDDYLASLLQVAGGASAAVAIGKPGYWEKLAQATKGEYRAQKLGNGYIRVDHAPSGLSGLFFPNGARKSGQLSIPHKLSVDAAPPPSSDGMWALHLFGEGEGTGHQGWFGSRAAAEQAKKELPIDNVGTRIVKKKRA